MGRVAYYAIPEGATCAYRDGGSEDGSVTKRDVPQEYLETLVYLTNRTMLRAVELTVEARLLLLVADMDALEPLTAKERVAYVEGKQERDATTSFLSEPVPAHFFSSFAELYNRYLGRVGYLNVAGIHEKGKKRGFIRMSEAYTTTKGPLASHRAKMSDLLHATLNARDVSAGRDMTELLVRKRLMPSCIVTEGERAENAAPFLNRESGKGRSVFKEVLLQVKEVLVAREAAFRVRLFDKLRAQAEKKALPVRSIVAALREDLSAAAGEEIVKKRADIDFMSGQRSESMVHLVDSLSRDARFSKLVSAFYSACVENTLRCCTQVHLQVLGLSTTSTSSTMTSTYLSETFMDRWKGRLMKSGGGLGVYGVGKLPPVGWKELTAAMGVDSSETEKEMDVLYSLELFQLEQGK